MKQYLFLTSALVVSGLLSGAAEAACIQTPSCSSLGYTSSSSCTGGIKCPFGNAWNCTASDLSTQITEITNKITTIEEKIVKIEKENATSNCKIGDILYSDMSCNTNLVISKTPIGVIFDMTNKLAIGLKESQLFWSTTDFDVPGVDNITDRTLAITDLDGKKNTSTILAYCKANGESCPPFEYVNSYKTEGTQAGDWYLPSMGELFAIYGNMGVLNVALAKIAATKLITSSYWSSSEYSRGEAWKLNFSSGNVYESTKYHGPSRIRPVLAF